MRSLGLILIHYNWCLIRREDLEQTGTEERPCEDTKRRWVSLSQREMAQNKSTLLTP